MDMSQFIVAKSDQLNSDDLMGGPRTVTITRVTGSDNPDQPVSVHYDGDGGKPYKPCKSMRRLMVAVWGKETAPYTGRSMTLYRDAEIQFGGMKVGGIRISHMSQLEAKRQVALTATRGKKAVHTVLPLKDAPKLAPRDFSAELEQLKVVARPGNLDALQSKWQDIGPDARKALAGELPGLKVLCEYNHAADDADVPFDAPQQTEGGGYDGA